MIDSGDKDFLNVMIDSSLEGKKQEQEIRVQKNTERAKRRAEKAKAKELKAVKEALKSGGVAIKIEKPDVLVKKTNTFSSGKDEIRTVLNQAFRHRVQKTAGSEEEESKGYELSDATKSVLLSIQKVFKNTSQTEFVNQANFPDMLETFGVTKKNLGDMDEKELVAKFTTIAEADATSLFEFFVQQGFDLWLAQSCLNAIRPHKVGLSIKKVQNISLCKRVRYLIENEYCGGQQIANVLDPERIRLPYYVPDKMKVQTFKLEEEEKAPADKAVKEENKEE